jgi:hypothetical protein
MRIRHCCAIAALGLMLGGCDYLGTSPEAKINGAFPLSDNISKTKEAVLQGLPAEKREAFEDELSTRMKLRALTCSASYSPSWFASTEEIRESVNDPTCFNRADAAIARWLDFLRIGTVLVQPPLKPIPEAFPKFFVNEESIKNAHFADDAGVGLFNSDSEAKIVDLETGKTLFKQSAAPGSSASSLSPNGRLFVVSAGSEIKVVEAETGATLLQLPDVRRDQFLWVGNEGALYRSAQDKVLFADFISGQEIPASWLRGLVGRVHPTAVENEYVVAGYRSLAKFRVERTPKETSVSLVDEKQIVNGVSSSSSGLSADGKYFFDMGKELLLISLDEMEETRIPFAPFNPSYVVPAYDPGFLIMRGSTSVPHPSVHRGYFVFSIEDRTLWPVKFEEARSGGITYIPPLKRNAVFISHKLEVLEEIPLGDGFALEGFLSELIALQNQAKIDAYERGASQGGLGGRSRYGLESDTTLPVPSAAPFNASAPLAGVSKDARIEGIGVYEAYDTGKQQPKTGTVNVRVRRSAKPVILVLSGYHRIKWNLTVEPGAQVGAILISSYEPAEVIGAGSARQMIIGRHSVHKRGDSEYNALDREVYQVTGKRIDFFQGTYRGASFVVGGS